MKLRKLVMGFVLQDGWSPLYMACQKGHLDVVKTLIEAGVNIHQADKVSTHIPTCIAWHICVHVTQAIQHEGRDV